MKVGRTRHFIPGLVLPMVPTSGMRPFSLIGYQIGLLGKLSKDSFVFAMAGEIEKLKHCKGEEKKKDKVK